MVPSTKSKNNIVITVLIVLTKGLILLGEGVIGLPRLFIMAVFAFGDIATTLVDFLSSNVVKLISVSFDKISFFFRNLAKKAIFKIPSIKLKPLRLKAIKIPKITVRKGQREKIIFKEKSRVRGLKYFLVGFVAAAAALFFYQSYLFIHSLPDPRLIGTVNYPVSTQIYDRNGKLLYEIFRDESRTPVTLSQLPEHVLQATIAVEDNDFYSHGGISFFGGVVRALRDMFRTGNLQGGSTITQQLVKSALLTPERTIERKIREAILAVWTEQLYDKKQILEMYLNQVPYGGSSYGIEEAAKTYFGIPASSLNLSQSAFLAGLPQAPSKYSPYVNPQLAIKRRNEVLSLMFEEDYISESEYSGASSTVLSVRSPVTFIRAPHFVFYVKAYLEEKFGIRRVEEGGLRVVTSLDVDLQEFAEDAVRAEIESLTSYRVSNGALLVTKPKSGEILAMVGSKNYFEQPFGAYNVVTARRQPGSAIKPLLYSLALQNGFTASTILQDTPVVFTTPGSKPYRPVNYDGRFHGSVPLRYALANSYNVPAVRTLEKIGVKNFISHAEQMGITTWDSPERYGLSLTLGGAEVKIEDMAVAFGVLANYGQKVPLSPVLSVTDFRGQTLYKVGEAKSTRVLPEKIAFIVNDILSDSMARRFAFGNYSKLDIPGHRVAVKTGTTNNLKDNWTIGYTREYLTAVWVGNNDNTTMSRVASGVTGASPIWHRLMNYILNHTKTPVPTQTPGVKEKNEFYVPAGLHTQKCYFGRVEYFLEESKNNCHGNIFTTPTPVQ